jgi:Protein of unknown function (DUF4236)
MGHFRFRKRIKLFPGLWLNASKRYLGKHWWQGPDGQHLKEGRTRGGRAAWNRDQLPDTPSRARPAPRIAKTVRTLYVTGKLLSLRRRRRPSSSWILGHLH